MTTKRRLLDSLVSLYDSDGCPLGADRLAESVSADPAEVREHLESFRSYDLVRRSDGGSGYRPTITDVDDEEVLIIEVHDEDDG